MVSQALLISSDGKDAFDSSDNTMPLVPILIFVWIFVPLVKHSRSSTFNLLTKAIMFVMLASMSVLYTFLGSQRVMSAPSILPEKISDIDMTFGFLTSYLVVPLLCIAEDRVDYSSPSQSHSPVNSAQSYSLFVRYSGVVRFLFGLIMCMKVAASPTNQISIDPFQLLLVCIFTVTSVSSKMTAYLYKFTENQVISLAMPCLISVLLVLGSKSDIGQINTVANYIATFFAYQFLVIIPFGLFYLRSE